MDATQAQIIANWINVAIAVATLAAVIVAFLALRKNDKQGKENWEHTQDTDSCESVSIRNSWPEKNESIPGSSPWRNGNTRVAQS